MKPIQLFLTLATVLAPAALHAAAPTFAQGDILMGFHATSGDGVADTYVVNLGSAASYRDATSNITPTLGNIGADLAAIYGANWRTRTDLFWGIAGCSSNAIPVNGDVAKVIYASRMEVTPGTSEGGWSGLNSTIRGEVATDMQQMTSTTSGFRSYQASSNSAFAVSQGTSDASSWAAFMAPGPQTAGLLDFDAFSDIEALPNQSLSLFRIAASTAGSYEGHFTISAAGVVTFVPAAATGTTYAQWAATNVNNQGDTLDFDGDGVPNGIEFFMGQSGSGFTANPQIALDHTITWNRATDRTVSSVFVQVSTDLVTWTNAPSGAVYNANSVVYTVPTGLTKHFIRLLVTP
ncbi:hypothetical protein [Luteolibacter soli]|uniref:F5/8 type C domain-containing protein n=1 Tax=Luteolibacter soli TaxID=3135280 RepID=A0ABU9AXZ7_9BACT